MNHKEIGMWYEKELKFCRTILEKMNLQVLELEKDEAPDRQIDFGVRRFFSLQAEYVSTFLRKPFEGEAKTIYKLTDRYFCNYLHLILPGESTKVLLIGPYISRQLSYEDLLHEAERFSISPQLFSEIEVYYGSIPVLVDDSFLFSVMNTLAEVLWGSSRAYRIVDVTEKDISPHPLSPEEELLPMEQTLLSMEDMEKLYAYENELLSAVTFGLTHKAELMLSNFSELALKHRVADPIRNMKNYCIIMNTLMRKAAERGSVHPVYLDQVSSDFARRIELISSQTTAYKMMKEMISDYCRLVNKHSMIDYSLPIRKTLVCIESNLAGSLTLHSLASLQNISSGYLSALFRKETGKTLTEYINRRRVRQAEYLLRSTALQIQTIAQFCGFPDANYFTKTFKRYSGTTPLEYRRSRQHDADGMPS